MTITPEQMTAVLAAAKEGRLRDRLHIDVWCDGTTACAVEAEPHGHWRGGWSVAADEVILQLKAERDALLEALDMLFCEATNPKNVEIVKSTDSAARLRIVLPLDVTNRVRSALALLRKDQS